MGTRGRSVNHRGKRHMAKRQSDKESHYKHIINKQKTIIKELKKQAGRGSKLEKKFDELESEFLTQVEDETKTEFLEPPNKCPSCKKGSLELVDLKVRKMFICTFCDYREVTK